MVGAKSCSTPSSTTIKLSTDDGDILDNPTKYRSLVGALKYITCTRPEIRFEVNPVCQFMHQPTITHMVAAKRILRYIKGTLHHGLLFSKGLTTLQVYNDVDWDGSPNDRRSTSGLCIFFGHNPISWSAKNQAIVARSSTEVEYRALYQTSAEVIGYVNFSEIYIFFFQHYPPNNVTTLAVLILPPTLFFTVK
ncbi:uncharacterized protein LOC113294200 [Papaver somniferum]|uniref:uncharacterized protein LOC113294200 n=1 Tax=Papaver somniferum TaxID=3469 RepID=UPI000E6F9532|nr:uncharacterized protein LOC113294200 [Papaver somniferum]